MHYKHFSAKCVGKNVAQIEFLQKIRAHTSLLTPAIHLRYLSLCYRLHKLQFAPAKRPLSRLKRRSFTREFILKRTIRFRKLSAKLQRAAHVKHAEHAKFAEPADRAEHAKFAEPADRAEHAEQAEVSWTTFQFCYPS